MTLRLILSIDPGQSGAVAALADGEFAGFADMPTSARKAGGEIIDPQQLGAAVRGLVMQHPGAHRLAVIEKVGAMPGQGGTGMFRFGQSDGMARGVIGCLNIPLIEVAPMKWKRHFGLVGTKEAPIDKDCARTLAIQRFPSAAQFLQRKKDIGRADALLIALWAHATEQASRAA